MAKKMAKRISKKEAAAQKKADLDTLKKIVEQKADTPEAVDRVRTQLAQFLFGDDAKAV